MSQMSFKHRPTTDAEIEDAIDAGNNDELRRLQRNLRFAIIEIEEQLGDISRSTEWRRRAMDALAVKKKQQARIHNYLEDTELLQNAAMLLEELRQEVPFDEIDKNIADQMKERYIT